MSALQGIYYRYKNVKSWRKRGMDDHYINLTKGNIEGQHLCCAIADAKHQKGVELKRTWLAGRIAIGHVFRKLDARGKVFIEYAPLETALVPVQGDDYLYIHCFWVSGSYAGKGHGTALLEACIKDARERGKAGICVLSSKTKKPFLSDKAFLLHHGFTVVDQAQGGYELLALSFGGTKPRFCPSARKMSIEAPYLTIFYSPQCPYIAACIDEVQAYCSKEGITLQLEKVDTPEKAKQLPCVFNNYAVFYNHRFQTMQLLNENGLKKLLQSSKTS